MRPVIGRVTVYSMQLPQPRFPRDNLSDTLAEMLRAMIVDGRLLAGARINEVHLSQQLGVGSASG